jgi:phage shock protein C
MNLQNKRLYRSRSQRMIAGVCGGVGEYVNLDPTLVRILFVLAGFLSAGSVILVYLAMMLVIPEEPIYSASSTPEAPAPEEPKDQA